MATVWSGTSTCVVVIIFTIELFAIFHVVVTRLVIAGRARDSILEDSSDDAITPVVSVHGVHSPVPPSFGEDETERTKSSDTWTDQQDVNAVDDIEAETTPEDTV